MIDPQMVWIVRQYDDVLGVYATEGLAEARCDAVDGAWYDERVVETELPPEFTPEVRAEQARRRATWEELPKRPGFAQWVQGQLPEDVYLDDAREFRMEGTQTIVVPILGRDIGIGPQGHRANESSRPQTVWDPLVPGHAWHYLTFDEWKGDDLVALLGSTKWMTLEEVAEELGIRFRDAQAAVDKETGLFMLTPRRRKAPVGIPTTTMNKRRMVWREAFEEVLSRR